MAYKPNFDETLGKMELLIFELSIGEDDIRTRLSQAFLEQGNLAPEDFPAQLQAEWEAIINVLTARGATEYYSAYENSLRGRRKSICAGIAKRIVSLYSELKWGMRNRSFE